MLPTIGLVLGLLAGLGVIVLGVLARLGRTRYWLRYYENRSLPFFIRNMMFAAIPLGVAWVIAVGAMILSELGAGWEVAYWTLYAFFVLATPCLLGPGMDQAEVAQGGGGGRERAGGLWAG